ncbi:hypothetical protein RI129_007729 [Pyrocoelia pectoralis]|uniref:Uncharacterized protein n=1 Tax=Pyrocoelia pectoralis TaxID=417401 RepID=A0AAN7VCW6_9COLE
MSIKSKIVFFVTVCVLLITIVTSKPHHKRHVKSSHQSNDLSNNPYQSIPGYQPQFYPPPLSSPYGYQPQPVQMPQMYPPLPNPYYMNFQFSPYMPMYQPYPVYFPYPYYQPYPYQPQLPNYPDPFAHIPTEIVDVDSDITIENHKPKIEVESSQHVSVSDSLQQPIQTSQVVTTKPIQTIITRTFNTNAKPIIDVQHSNLQPGSDAVVEVKSSDDYEKESGKKAEEKNGNNKEEKSLLSLFG